MQCRSGHGADEDKLCLSVLDDDDRRCPFWGYLYARLRLCQIALATPLKTTS